MFAKKMFVKKNRFFGVYKKKFFALFFLFFSFVLGLSLFSFNLNDRSWFYYNAKNAGKNIYNNWLGSVGSNLASMFLYLFGVSAFLFIPFFFYVGYIMIRNISFKNEIERFFAFLFMPFVLSAILSFHKFDFYKSIFPGGVIGNGIKIICTGWFDSFGAKIFLYSVFIIFLVLIFRKAAMLFLRLLHKIGSFVCSRQKFLIPAYIVFKKVLYAFVYIVITPFVFSFKFCKKLFTGQDFVGENKSVIEFENYTIDISQKDDLTDLYNMLNRHENNNLNDFKDLKETQESVFDACKLAGSSCASSSGASSSGASFGLSDKIENQELEVKTIKKYNLPGFTLFDYFDTKSEDNVKMEELKLSAKVLEEKLEMFGIFGKVVSIKRGPVVTLFEYNPKADSKISKIVALGDDLALALKALSIRIIAPIPGKSVVGFEVSNAKREDVLLSSIINSKEFEKFDGSLPIVLGKDTIGNNVVVDLAKMPHLLIAGSTGSGKSVALNTLLVSILCKLTPDELNLILIDPKRLEFSAYEDIAHLLFPIVTDPKKVVPILKWVVNKMEERYEKMAKIGAKNIFDYNDKISKNKLYASEFEGEKYDKMPFLVIIVDELADLMMTVGKDLEASIMRIAQMARAAGIHMIVATQRPSVDVITGVIKVNFPSRISFRVTSKVDSRTILDCCGAEKLLGRGDMLFLGSGSAFLSRLHGAYVSGQEIEKVVNHIKSERKVVYRDCLEYLSCQESNIDDLEDVLYVDVTQFLESADEVSISLLQRKFRIGYNRSARIIEQLESDGLILPSDGGKMRKVVR